MPTFVVERGAQRVVRAGPRRGLEVVWIEDATGWGVRTSEALAPGDFVCEYAGELLHGAEVDARCYKPPGRDAYLFDLATQAQCIASGAYPAAVDATAAVDAAEAAADVAEAKPGGEAAHSEAVDDDDEPAFVIDAFAYGNVGRFVNHACGPSLLANITQVFVYTEDAPNAPIDARLPRVAFFYEPAHSCWRRIEIRLWHATRRRGRCGWR